MSEWAPQGFEYGYIKFEGDSSTCSSPGAKFVERELGKSQMIPENMKAFAIYQKNNDMR
jgi:hypothetical protein